MASFSVFKQDLEIPTQTPITRKRAIWSFNPTTKEWGLVQTNGDSIDRVSHGAYASAQIWTCISLLAEPRPNGTNPRTITIPILTMARLIMG